MATTLNDAAYRELIRGDIDWLKANTKRCLERTHIISILREYEKDLLSNDKR
jgi:hypothetical protein